MGLDQSHLFPTTLAVDARKSRSRTLVDNQSCVIVGVQATAARMSQETVAAQDMLARFAACQGREPESVERIPPTGTESSCSG